MSTKLNPTLTTKTKAKTVAEQEGRKRGVLAINEDGKLVVCCRRTAKKNGWEVQDVLYERTKATPKVEAAPVVEPVKAVAKARRGSDTAEAKAKAKKAKAVVDAALDDILGK
jgi:hypothetical protein